MPLEPTPAWNAAFSSTPVVDIYSKITVDVAAAKIVELTSSPNSQLGHPTMLGTLAPIGAKIDPLTFRNESKAEFNVGLSETELSRFYVVNKIFLGKVMEIKLGAAALSNVSDYLGIWKGIIDDIEPEEGGGYNMRCRGAWHPLLKALYRKNKVGLGDNTQQDSWYGNHELVIMEEILDTLLESSFINSASFDPDDAANASIGHHQVGRGVHGQFDRRMQKDVQAKTVLDSLSEVFQTAVVAPEDGRMTAKPYLPDDPALGTFDGNAIIPESWEQGGIYFNLINEVIYWTSWKGKEATDVAVLQKGSDNSVEDAFGSGATATFTKSASPHDYEIRYVGSDILSQAKYRYNNSVGRQRRISNEVSDQWTGIRGTLADQIPEAAGEGSKFRIYGGWSHSFWGGAFTGLNTNRQLSTTKLAHVKIGGELISLKNCTQSFVDVTEDARPPTDNDGITSPDVTQRVFGLEFTIRARGVNGTSAETHEVDAEVRDFSPAIDHTTKKLRRHANGAPVAKFDTPILPSTVQPQIGEIWLLTYDRWISEGMDGLVNHKVQIIEKTWDVDAGVINWEICLVPTYTLSLRGLDFPVLPKEWGDIAQLRDWFGSDSVWTAYVANGLEVKGVGGSTLTVGKGLTSANGSDNVSGRLQDDITFAVTLSKDYYIYFDHYAHAIIFYKVNTGAGEPTEKPPNLMLLAEVIVGAAQIDTINDQRTLTGIRTSKLDWSLWGDASDGITRITGTVTQTRPMLYDRLIVETGGTLIMNGYEVHCNVLDMRGSEGVIHNDGGDGGDGGTPSAGADAPLAGVGTLGPGGAGGKAGAGDTTFGGAPGTDGSDGGDANPSKGGVGGTGGDGAQGGSGGDAGGTGGSPGTLTLTKHQIRSLIDLWTMVDTTEENPRRFQGGTGGGGGAGAGKGDTPGGGDGGGGGAGASAGAVGRIFANRVLVAGVEANARISVNGGVGGDGGGGANTLTGGGGGGGGGGAGGGGGLLMLTYGEVDDLTALTNLMEASGGSGGTGGDGGTGPFPIDDGDDGANGAAGDDGTVIIHKV